MSTWLLLFVILSTCALYTWWNDAKLARIPPEALAISPKRWSADEITACHAKLASGPTSLFEGEGKLPPKTGRRYIVVGGVSVFPKHVVVV